MWRKDHDNGQNTAVAPVAPVSWPNQPPVLHPVPSRKQGCQAGLWQREGRPDSVPSFVFCLDVLYFAK